MSTEIKGKVIVLNATEQVSEKFSKRLLVIETEGQYPQKIAIEAQQDKCAMLDAYRVGQVVNSHVNIDGRSWVSPQGEEKFFNTLKLWKIEAVGNVTTPDAF
jgi:hypothetical protein